jgi:serpin B
MKAEETGREEGNMRKWIVWGALLLLFPLVQARDDPAGLVENNTAFALDLYRILGAREGNLFFSPYSLSTALAMTYAGARGATAAQMADALHFPPDSNRLHPLFADLQQRLNAIQSEGDVRLHSANALWIEKTYSILPDFLDTNRTFYNAGVFQADFVHQTESTRLEINQWTADKTNDRIPELIPPDILTELTRMVLTNAVYFFGEWASPFNPEATRDADFFVTPDSPVQAPLMYKTGRFGYAEDESCQALEIPYKGGDLAMLILLPRRKGGLAGLEKTLGPAKLSRLSTDLKTIDVRAFVPRFKQTGTFSLEEALGSLGMIDAFTRDADFTGMEPRGELFVSTVCHQAFVSVDEAGTEAAAATAVVMALKAAMPLGEPPTFRADHPFIFLIRDIKTGTVLFLGRLVNPSIS